MKSWATHFSPDARTNIGCYVYALIDPRKRQDNPRRVFYVGRGRRDRCFQHALAERKWVKRVDGPNFKLQQIREIRRVTKKPPPIQILCHNLSDSEAHPLEAIFIKFLMTNQIAGEKAHKYCLPTDELEGIYSSHPVHVTELKGSVLLVSLNGGKNLDPYPRIPAKDFAKRTLGYWPVGQDKAERVDYVIGVYDQLVRLVYRTIKANGKTLCRWHNCPTDSGRTFWRVQFLLGKREFGLEKQWRNRRIINAKGTNLTRFVYPQTSCNFIPVAKNKR
jgi:hypothetical protein